MAATRVSVKSNTLLLKIDFSSLVCGETFFPAGFSPEKLATGSMALSSSKLNTFPRFPGTSIEETAV
jgi:hypothetical protein